MTRALVVGDLHADARLSGRDYYDDVAGALLADVVQRVEPGTVVVQLGDVCDPDRGARTFRAVDLAANFARLALGRGAAAVWFVAGNHDVIDDAKCADCPSPLHVLENIDGVYVAEEPRIDAGEFGVPALRGRVLMLPWRSRAHCADPQAEMLSAFQDLLAEGADPVTVFCHLDVPGIDPGPERDMPRLGRLELPREILEHPRVRLVVAGHYHAPGRWGKVEVAGSLVRLGFGEAADDKRILEVEI